MNENYVNKEENMKMRGEKMNTGYYSAHRKPTVLYFVLVTQFIFLSCVQWLVFNMQNSKKYIYIYILNVIN